MVRKQYFDPELKENQSFKEIGGIGSKVVMEIKKTICTKFKEVIHRAYPKKGWEYERIRDNMLDSTNCKDDFTLPELTCLPKMHKREEKDIKKTLENNPEKLDIPFRALVSAHSNYATNASIILNTFFSGFIEDESSIVKNINKLIRELELITCPKGYKFIISIIDVITMYPNVDKELLLSQLVKHLDEIRKHSRKLIYMSNESIIEIIRFILENTLISHLGMALIQLLGLIMGNNMAPPLANIHLWALEMDNEFIQKIKKPFYKIFSDTVSLLYKRYLDDILWIFAVKLETTEQRILEIINIFKESYNSMAPKIKVTIKYISKPGRSIEYLDLDLMIKENDSKLSFKPFFKKYNKYAFINYNSYHPMETKKGFIVSSLQRFMTHCSNEDLFEETKPEFKDRLLNNNYDVNLIDLILNNFEYNYAKRYNLLTRVDKEDCLPMKIKLILKANYVKKIQYNLTEEERNERKLIKKENPIFIIIRSHPLNEQINYTKLITTDNKFYKTLPIHLKNIIQGYTNPPNIKSRIVQTKLIKDPLESKLPQTWFLEAKKLTVSLKKRKLQRDENID